MTEYGRNGATSSPFYVRSVHYICSQGLRPCLWADLALTLSLFSEAASNLITKEENSNTKQLETNQPFPSGKLLPFHKHIPVAH